MRLMGVGSRGGSTYCTLSTTTTAYTDSFTVVSKVTENLYLSLNVLTALTLQVDFYRRVPKRKVNNVQYRMRRSLA